MVRWESKPLAAVCKLVNRGISPVYVEKSGVAVLNQKCVRDHALNFALGRRHDAVAKKVPADRFLRAGDVLVNSTGTGTLGRVAQLRSDPTEPTTVDSHVTIVRPIEGEFHREFFGYALIAIEDQIQQGGEGCGGQTELSRSKLANDYLVSYPKDLDEQRRIVAVLDKAFEGIDAAIANSEKNLANAREIFSSYVAEIFEKGDAEWTETTIGAEVDLQTGFAFRSQNYTNDLGGVRLLRGDNVVQGELRWDDVKRWPSTDRDAYSEYELEENDIVLAMDRTWIKAGIKFARISRDDVPALLVQRVARMRCRKALSDGLLFHLLGSRLFEKYVLAIQTGLGVPHISGKRIQSFRFVMPKVATQHRIVEKLDTMRAHYENLIANYQDKVALLDALKQSILHKAFAGKLTASSAEAVPEAAE